MAITFNTLMQRLAYGELKNTAATKDCSLGEISSNYRDLLLTLINKGLVDIYTNKLLKKDTVTVNIDTNQKIYPMVNISLPVPHITDVTYDPSLYIKPLCITDNEGKEYIVDTCKLITTPSYDTLKFKQELLDTIGSEVTVEYQALHGTITYTDNINLPPNLETVLQLYVAALYFNNLDAQQHKDTGDRYFGLYLKYMSEDTDKNLSSTSEIEEHDKFNMRGFV